jgi:hypothetical protein
MGRGFLDTYSSHTIPGPLGFSLEVFRRGNLGRAVQIARTKEMKRFLQVLR